MPKLTKRFVESIPVGEHEVIHFDSELRGFGVRVWPSGKRSYFLKYRSREGRQRKPTIGIHGVITAEQARDMARQWLAEAARGSDPATMKRQAREMPTLADLAERYLAKHARPHKKASSLANDERLLAKRILPTLGRRKLNDIGRADIAKLHEGLRDKPYEANRMLALLSHMFNLAEDWELRGDGTNPCRRITRYKEDSRSHFLDMEKLGRLGAALAEAERTQACSPSAINAIKLLVFTGCRLSEVLTLRWSEVDLERSMLHLSDSKTGRKTIHLSTPARQILRGIRPVEGNPYVLPGRKLGAHLVNLEKPWRQIREQAGLGDVRLHDLRHSFASAGAANGLSLPLLGALLGHTQPTTTNRYAHLAAEPVRQANELVGQYLSGALASAETATPGATSPSGEPA